MNAMVIEMIAGLRSGNTAAGFFKMSTQTVGLSTIKPTDMTAPEMMAHTAPCVLKRLHTIDSSRGGKFALADN